MKQQCKSTAASLLKHMSKPKTPDRFDQAVVRQFGRVLPVRNAWTAILLRRQHAADRRRMVQLVKQQTRWSLDKHGCLTTQPDGQWISREDLLKALKGKL
jgi:hypothetical protein